MSVFLMAFSISPGSRNHEVFFPGSSQIGTKPPASRKRSETVARFGLGLKTRSTTRMDLWPDQTAIVLSKSGASSSAAIAVAGVLVLLLLVGIYTGDDPEPAAVAEPVAPTTSAPPVRTTTPPTTAHQDDLTELVPGPAPEPPPPERISPPVGRRIQVQEIGAGPER